MARSDVHPVHRFESWQVWPGSYDNPPTDGNYPSHNNSGLKITPTTPIASMGSCFAREIRRRLLNAGYAYITEETHHPAAIHASAAWERLYNTIRPHQALGYRTPVELFNSIAVAATNEPMVESLIPGPLRIARPNLNIVPILS